MRDGVHMLIGLLLMVCAIAGLATCLVIFSWPGWLTFASGVVLMLGIFFILLAFSEHDGLYFVPATMFLICAIGGIISCLIIFGWAGWLTIAAGIVFMIGLLLFLAGIGC